MNIDIQAAGTWMKMMRYDSPCVASVGATKNATQRPASASSPARIENHGISFPAIGKNACGAAKRKRSEVINPGRHAGPRRQPRGQRARIPQEKRRAGTDAPPD